VETQHNEQAIAADEPFLQPLAGPEARIAAVIAPVCAQAGFRLVRVRLSGLNGLTLQIMAERYDGSMSVEDCEQLSRGISPLLDVENIIDRHYNLEVSSPGIDRPLVRRSDFAAWRGHLAKIATHNPVAEKKKWRGIIAAVSEEAVTLRCESEETGAETLDLPFTEIADASLVLTDALIRAALQRDKQEKRRPPAAAQAQTED